jgi:hypothetical protein
MSWPRDVMSVGEVNNESLPLDNESEYEIVQGVWSTCPAKGVANPTGIRWVGRKWKGWTLQKLYSSIRSISERAKVEGEEASYEDHISCLDKLQE